MKDFGEEALAAIQANQAMSVGAVSIGLSPDPVRIWGGYGEITIGDDVFVGVGDRGLVSVVGAALGGAEQNMTLELSGVDPNALALFDMAQLRGAPVVVYRLIFDKSGHNFLAAPVYARGRLDQAPKEETPGGQAVIRALVETAARGLRRGGGRTRSYFDQVLNAPADDGLRGVAYAGQNIIYWGGKPPQSAQAAFGGWPGGQPPVPNIDPFVQVQ